MDKRKAFSRLPALVVIAIILFICSIVTSPKIPDNVPRQQHRDSIGAAKCAYYQGARP